MRHIAVLGAGIAGVMTAYALTRRGYAVTVFDRQHYAAMETSFANGGQISVSNAEVWNSWATVFKGIKWMLKPDAPLLMNPRPSWHKYSWMAEFMGQIGRYRANTIETTKLALTARQRLFSIAEQEGIQFDLERRGILHIYRDPASFKHAQKVSKMLAEGGLERHEATLEDIRKIEPALSGNFYGGFFTPSDATGDIHKFTRGLASACARQGVSFVYGAAIERLTHLCDGIEIRWCPDPDFGRRESASAVVDGVVVCAGVGSRAIASMLGDRVNIYPVKGYSITVHLDSAASQQAAPWVSLLDDEAKIVTSRLGAGRFRVAGTAEFNGENRDIRADRIRPLVEWTRRLFPGVETDRVVPWSGLRPMLPNMIPRISKGCRPAVFYNTGHGHLGWTLSAATAELTAENIAVALPAV